MKTQQQAQDARIFLGTSPVWKRLATPQHRLQSLITIGVLSLLGMGLTSCPPQGPRSEGGNGAPTPPPTTLILPGPARPAGSLGPAASPEPSVRPAVPAAVYPTTPPLQVVRVVDGDTIVVAQVGKVRMIGIDTPETVDPRRPTQRCGPEASALTHQLLDGRQVRLAYEGPRLDKYGRTLAYVWVLLEGATTSDTGWVIVQEVLLRHGLAKTYRHKYTSYSMRRTWQHIENDAIVDGVGLWSPVQCVEPPRVHGSEMSERDEDSDEPTPDEEDARMRQIEASYFSRVGTSASASPRRAEPSPLPDESEPPMLPLPLVSYGAGGYVWTPAPPPEQSATAAWGSEIPLALFHHEMRALDGPPPRGPRKPWKNGRWGWEHPPGDHPHPRR